MGKKYHFYLETTISRIVAAFLFFFLPLVAFAETVTYYDCMNGDGSMVYRIDPCSKGQHEVRRLKVDPNNLDPDYRESLVASINSPGSDAAEQVKKESEAKAAKQAKMEAKLKAREEAEAKKMEQARLKAEAAEQAKIEAAAKTAERARLEAETKAAKQTKAEEETKLKAGAKAKADEFEVAKKPVADNSDDVLKVVNEWAAAWSSKNVKRYLDFYMEDFKTPDGESRSAWEAQRSERIRNPRFIHVSISSPKVEFMDDSHASVSFKQSYRASHLKNFTGKTLVLVKAGSRWLIQEEAKAKAHVETEVKKAVEWYRQAAEQGNAEAQSLLGVMYNLGQGVPQDYNQAVKWHLKAAEQGDTVARLNLGVIYDKGLGVPQDYAQAYLWLNLAATSGNKEAIRNRDYLAFKMTASQIEEAQRMAREWAAQHTKEKP